MRIETTEKLRSLHQKFGPGTFGKIAQKLLALGFRAMGFEHLVERGVQGVDIDAASAEERYAFEVKTTEGSTITLDESNLEALKDRAKDGYAPSIAILRLAIFEDWLLASLLLDQLRPGEFLIDKFRAYRLKDLEAKLVPAFEKVVQEHFHGTLTGGQHYLNNHLRAKGIDVSEGI